MRVILTGGGTAGHINPALAIGERLLQDSPDAKILYVGSENGIEKELAEKAGFDFVGITVKGFRRRLSVDTFKSVVALFKGLLAATGVLRRFKPDIVIGTGGYVCGPVVMLSALTKAKTAIHEQNAYPGVTNKILSRFVDQVMISYEESRSFFKRSKSVVYTGNPVRSVFVGPTKVKSREDLGISPEKKMILSFGGSGGASKINDVMLEVQNHYKGQRDVLVYHITGKRYYESYLEKLKNTEIKLNDNIKVIPYTHEMHLLMSASDVVISRAGAISMAEIATLGCVSILVPSPNVANNHQEHNARTMANEGAAIMLLEKDLNTQSMLEMISNVLAGGVDSSLISQKTSGFSMANAINEIAMVLKTLY